MDKIITAYQKLFKDYIADNEWSSLGGIKKVYRWDPYHYPTESMPCLYIEPMQSAYMPQLQYDRRDHPIEIWLIISIKDGFWPSDDDGVTIKKIIVDMVEWTEAWTMGVRWDTIVWLIQKNPCLHDVDNSYAITNEVKNVQASYKPIRGTKWDIWYKATITLTPMITGLR